MISSYSASLHTGVDGYGDPYAKTAACSVRSCASMGPGCEGVNMGRGKSVHLALVRPDGTPMVSHMRLLGR